MPETTDLVSLYDMNGNTSFNREADPAQAANLIDEFIRRKRLDMEWCDRYHCSIFS